MSVSSSSPDVNQTTPTVDSSTQGTHHTLIRGKVVTPDAVLSDGWIIVKGEEIVQVGEGAVPAVEPGVRRAEVKAPYIIPGFVDIHNHGLGGCEEVCDHWTVPEYSLRRLVRAGTTSVLASLIFSKARPQAVYKCIDAIEERCGKAAPDCAVIEGIHAEGPLIADSGGLPPCEPDMSLEEFKTLCAAMPSMTVMTIAPSLEAPRAYDRLQHLLEIGVRPSLGHDKRCTEKEILGALALRRRDPEGAKGRYVGSTAVQEPMHLTHCFNVMAPVHHRNVGLANFALCGSFPHHPKYSRCRPPTCELIGDLIHVHPLAMLSLFSARNLHKDVALISDCIAHYDGDEEGGGSKRCYNGRRITVRAEGGCFLADAHGRPTPTLAGSTSTLADQFLILVQHFAVDVVTACRMLSTNPAEIAKIDRRVGSIASGKKANLLLLNEELDVIEKTMVYGSFTSNEPHVIPSPTPTHLAGLPAKKGMGSFQSKV